LAILELSNTPVSRYHPRIFGGLNVLVLLALQVPRLRKYSTALNPFADDIQFRNAIRSPQGIITRPTVHGTASRYASVQYKRQTHLRAIPSVIQTSFALHSYVLRTVLVMHFFKSTIVFALAFVTFAVAAPGGTTLELRGDGGDGDCKPLLQSCSTNSECCADLCVAGVSVHVY